MQALFGNGFILPEISPFRAGCPQPERRNHVYFQGYPKHLKPRREKVFGLARGFPHDRNARVRIEAYVLAWNAKHKQEGQAPRADHRRVLACVARAAVAFHELPGRGLLPLL